MKIMIRIKSCRLIFLPLLLVAKCLLAQDPATSLQITGAVKESLTLTAADLAKLPRATLRTGNAGTETVYEGVWLSEILAKAGAPQGNEMRGKALTAYVLASAQDGYQVLLSLIETDPSMADGQFLVADHANGVALSGTQGSFRLVPGKDKRPTRSVRALTRIEVVQAGK